VETPAMKPGPEAFSK